VSVAASGQADTVSAMPRIYALANQKGGVGKTTSAVNIAACLAEAGARTLLVDFDPQANATTGLGLRPPRGRSTYELLHGGRLEDVIVPSGIPNLDLAPAHPDLAAAAVELPDRDDRDAVLGRAIAEVGSVYPYVIVDCPPSLGLLTLNALAAANRLIVPVQCEYYALEGLTQLLESVELIRARINPDLALTGLLLTMHDGRTRLSSDVAAEVRNHFGAKVFTSVVPRSVRLAEAPSHGLPITAYDPRSAGADAYYRVAMEVVERG
jgi:chromosome partitioning protein